MNKRLIPLLLILALLVCACEQETPSEIEAPFEFYYPAVNVSYADGALCSQTVSLDPSQFTAEELVCAYLDSTPPDNARAAIPTLWSFYSASIDGSTFSVMFSGRPVSAAERSIACSCLAKTLLQLENVLRVSITTPGSELPLILTESDILLNDTSMLPQEETVTLYFPDAQRRYLTRETQTVEAMGTTQKARFILEQLLSSNNCIPADTQLLSVQIENGVCTVNLSSQFIDNADGSFSAERIAVYSIVNSLTELPEITTVDLWVAGAPPEHLHWLELENSLTRDESLIAAPADKDAVDATLYPAGGSSGLLVPIPLTLEGQDTQTVGELLMNALISFESENGVRSCIPAGTKLLSLRVENGVCAVDLTGEFLDGCADEAEEKLAMRSVVATMCTLPEINSVEILVEGIEPAYRNSSLLGMHMPQPGWFAR